MEKPLSRVDLVEYLIRQFDVGLSIHDVRELTAPDEETLTVKEYSIREDAQFTPTLIFFDLDGKEVFRVDSERRWNGADDRPDRRSAGLIDQAYQIIGVDGFE